MVLYNEFNPDEEAIGAVSHADLKSRPDAVIVVGTSLKVPGIRRLAKELCQVTRGRRGGFTAWINHDPEPMGPDFKDCWDLVVRGECDDVARHVGLPKWDDKDYGDYKLVTKAELKARGGLAKVVVDLKPLDVLKTQGFLTPVLTPGASPRQQSPAPPIGTSKVKQSQLSFATKALTGEDPKGKKKKPGRKPAVSKPTNKITNAFTATKTATKSTKLKGDTDSLIGHEVVKSEVFANPLFPGLATKLGPMSPTDHRNNTDLSSYKTEFEIQLPEIHEDRRNQYHQEVSPKSSSPKTPTTPETRPYDRHATISPRSVPSGMENLIT